MLPLNRIKSLLDYLRIGEPSLESIMKFVCLDTLFDYSAMTLFLNIVRIDGSVHIPASFGCELENMKLIPQRLVSTDTPVNRSLRTGVVTDCGDSESYLFAGPGYSHILFPSGFESSFAWPVPGVGSVVAFCSKKKVLSIEDEEFLIVIGEILAIEMTRVHKDLELGRGNTTHAAATNIALTPRQWTILNAIKKGHTNAEIARELGFSESLIRQETVQIYRKLGVSGRREILESDQELLRVKVVTDAEPPI